MKLAWLLVLPLGATVAGCVVTDERIVPNGSPGAMVNTREDDDGEPKGKQARYEAAVEEHPEDPRNWWRLGDYYESIRDFPAAVAAYQKLRELCQDAAVKDHRAYTAGDFHIGVCFAKARQFSEAVPYLRAVLALQPKDDREASLNRHFREAHYWLGAIYFENGQWEPAREHFKAYERIGGDPYRVDPWLLRIEDATGIKDGTIERVPAKPDPKGAAPKGDAKQVTPPVPQTAVPKGEEPSKSADPAPPGH